MPAYDVTCDFTNSGAVTVTLNKKWVNSFKDDAFAMKINSGTPQNAVSAGGDNTNSAVVTASVPYNSNITFAEAAVGAHTNTGIYVSSWQCTDTNSTNGNGLSGSVANVKANFSCTFTNTASKVVLLKNVNGGSASASEWNLIATAGGGSSAPTVTVPGGAGGTDGTCPTANANNTAAVTPGQSYRLSETLADVNSNPAYLLTAIQVWTPGHGPDCNGTGTWTTVSDPSGISVAAGQTAVYRFVNSAAPALILPLTGGIGTDAYAIAGLIALLIAAGLAFWQRRRLIRVGR
jgi:LPXTG-motif cell wall-anchored protein